MNVDKLKNSINEVFVENFGRTPLRERFDDIFRESVELTRFTDIKNLKEEGFDLFCSLVQLFNECEFDIPEGVQETLEKINRRKDQYKSLGRKLKIAILGGAFDPITSGHIKVAQLVLNSSKEFDEVWLMPCYKHINCKNMMSSDHRLEMCKLASQADGRIKVFPYEIENKLSGETFCFVKHLLEDPSTKDKYHFSMILGQDNANTFPSWPGYEYLERSMRFVVVPRKGVTIDPKVQWYLRAPHIFIAPNSESDLLDISSTIVRKLLSENSGNIELLDAKVMQYIVDHNLYRK